jgi:hypothetical protein
LRLFVATALYICVRLCSNYNWIIYGLEYRVEEWSMTKEEARLFKERWLLVNERIIDEVRGTPCSIKLQQLASMFVAGPTNKDQTEEEVWRRWQYLRERLNA